MRNKKQSGKSEPARRYKPPAIESSSSSSSEEDSEEAEEAKLGVQTAAVSRT